MLPHSTPFSDSHLSRFLPLREDMPYTEIYVS
jgi:hypothetical protein